MNSFMVLQVMRGPERLETDLTPVGTDLCVAAHMRVVLVLHVVLLATL